jgi:hypothetical protein
MFAKLITTIMRPERIKMESSFSVPPSRIRQEFGAGIKNRSGFWGCASRKGQGILKGEGSERNSKT